MLSEKRVFVFLLILVIALFGVSASSGYAEVDDKENTFELIFNKNVYLDDLESSNSLNWEDADIRDIQFEIVTAEDVLTIGYSCDAEGFDYDSMIHDISETLDLKYEDNTLPVQYDVFSLPLKEISVSSTDKNNIIENIEQSFSFESESDYDLMECIPVEDDKACLSDSDDIDIISTSEDETFQLNAAKKKTIDGSYHYKKTSGHTYQNMWHSQSTGSNSKCSSDISSPHEGDGNSRYKDGFQWFPNKIKANFKINKETTPVVRNSTKLSYYYNKSTLNNLQHDSNETLEMEVIFYNYPNETVTANKGLSFQKRSNFTYLTNQPGAYKDTNLFDTKNGPICFCIGVNDANKLKAEKWYYWEIISKKGDKKGYANDGRFKINAQRGYRYLTNGAYGIFSEEHEKTISYGKTSKQNWVPNTNAWKLANNNTTWQCNTTDGPIS